MPYIPAVASLAAAHKRKIKNIRAAVLKDTKEERSLGAIVCSFEIESIEYDKQSTDVFGTLGMYVMAFVKTRTGPDRTKGQFFEKAIKHKKLI